MFLIIFPILFKETSSEFLANFYSRTTSQNLNEKELEICCSGRNCSTLGDGFCDVELFTEQCLWDSGDCLKCHKSCTLDILFDGRCQNECFTQDCIFDIDDCDGRKLLKINIPDENYDFLEFNVNKQKIKVSKHMESNFGPLRFNNIKKLDGYFNYDDESDTFINCSLTFTGEFYIHNIQINETGIEYLNIFVQDYGKFVMANVNFTGHFAANFEIKNESVTISDLSQKETSFNITMNYKLASNQNLPKRIFFFKFQAEPTIFSFNLLNAGSLNISNIFSPSSFDFMIKSDFSSIYVDDSNFSSISINSSNSSIFINSTNIFSKSNFLAYFKDSQLTIIESSILGCLDQFNNSDPLIELIGVSFIECSNSNFKKLAQAQYLVSGWLADSSLWI